MTTFPENQRLMPENEPENILKISAKKILYNENNYLN